MTGITATDIVLRAREQMQAITGLSPDTVSRFDRDGDGWAIGIDMLEHRSIPRTHDLIASFEVSLTADGTVTRWKRTGRFQRGQGQAGEA